MGRCIKGTMNKREFKKIIKENEREVKTWAKWKQQIVISATAAKTGKYIEELNK